MTGPLFPDSWFAIAEPDIELRYVGMRREQALFAAEADGVPQVRIFEIPLPENTAFMADRRPKRLNLMIVEGKVARAAFF